MKVVIKCELVLSQSYDVSDNNLIVLFYIVLYILGCWLHNLLIELLAILAVICNEFSLT